MNLLCTYFLVILKILITTENYTNKTKCDPNQSNEGEIKYSCHPGLTGSKTSIHVNSTLLTIECNNTNILDKEILPSENYNNITKLKLTECPLLKKGIKDILNRFNMTNLKQLTFSLANITNYTLSVEAMGLIELETLELVRSNDLSHSGIIFKNTPNLSVLILNHSVIKLTEDLFSNIPNLTELILISINITYIPRNTFDRLSKLNKLDLSNNTIQRIESGILDDLVNLKQLNISFNEIQIIEENAFKNLNHLVEIRLGRNQLKQISRKIFMNCKNIQIISIESNPNVTLIDDIFSQFTNLREVNLSHNFLSSISRTLFNGSVDLRVIHLDHNKLISLDKNIFEGLENLEILHLDSNRIESLPADIFSPLKNLKHLYLQHNIIKRINETVFRKMRNLIEINLSYNKIISVHPDSLIGNNQLQKFSMSNNEFDFVSSDEDDIFVDSEFSANLEEIDLSYNNITEYPNVFTRLFKIKSINLKNNFIRHIELTALSKFYNGINVNINLDSNNITTISINHPYDLPVDGRAKTIVTITQNPIICDCDTIHLATFIQKKHELKKYIWFEPKQVPCSGLVKGNNETLNEINLKDLICPLKNCSRNGDCDCFSRSVDKTIVVNCSKRNLTSIPEITLTKWPKFKIEVHLENNRLRTSPGRYDGYANVTHLYLQGNEIANLTWIPASLKILNLRNNSLSSLNDGILKLFNETKIENVSFGYNPWRCDCEASNFTDFIRAHIKQIDASDIRCETTGKELVKLNKKYLCSTNTILILILSLSILSFIFLLTVMMSVYFKYKKKLRIWLYDRGLCLCCIKEDEIDEDKIYDAFISYSHKDEDFVNNNLISILESEEQPYKLCIHVRDFIPGEYIRTQIVDSIRDSRRTIVVLTPSFLESVWGKLEFRTAHTEAMLEGRARVIIIIYGDIDLEHLDEDLKSYIKTNTYVEWGDPWFWMKLRYALPKRNRRSVMHFKKHAIIMQYINDKFAFMRRDSNSYTVNRPPITSDRNRIEEKRFTYNAC